MLASMMGALALLAPSTAPPCQTAQPAPPLDLRARPLQGYQPLDDRALGALLRGRVLKDLRREPPNLFDGHYLERFDSDGAWTYFGGRAEQSGTYEIRNGAVCVTRSGAKGAACRAIWRNARGQYLATDEGVAGSLMVSRIVIQEGGGQPGEGRAICD